MAKVKNLLKTDFGYCFRIIVPEDLREAVGQREFRVSLKERTQAPAARKAQRLTRQFKEMFASLRKETEPETIDPAAVQRILRAKIERSVEGMAEARIVRPFRSPEMVDRYLENLGFRITALKMKLATGDLTEIKPEEVDSLASEMGLGPVLPGSDDYKRLAAWLLRARITEIEKVEKLTAGDFEFNVLDTVERRQVEEKQSNGITLSELAAEFWSEKKTTWKVATVKEYKRFNEILLEYFGESQRISELSFEHGREYLAHLKKLKTPAGKAMSASRRNDYIGYAGSLWTFAIRRHHCTDNIMDGLKTARKRKASRDREAFSKDDIRKLFVESPEYRLTGRNAIKRADHFFIPLIAAYSALRIEEICSLHVKDIIDVDGVACFSINERGEGKSLKTLSSERTVPIHGKLIELGLLDYVDTMKAQKTQRLFSKLRPQNSKYSHSVSKWFGKMKRRNGFGPNKVFHSFRHGALTEMHRAGADKMIISRIAGHSQGEDITASVYIKESPVAQMKEALDVLDYGIDLSHLKRVWSTMSI